MQGVIDGRTCSEGVKVDLEAFFVEKVTHLRSFLSTSLVFVFPTLSTISCNPYRSLDLLIEITFHLSAILEIIFFLINKILITITIFFF